LETNIFAQRRSKRKFTTNESSKSVGEDQVEENFDSIKSAMQVPQKKRKSTKKKLKPSDKLTCNDCGASFEQKGHLKRHINGVHLKIMPYECDKCQKSFTTRNDLKKHIERGHEKLKPFQCSYCDSSFSQKHQLKSHENRMHLKIKPLKKVQCSDCEACFERKTCLGISHLPKEKRTPKKINKTLKIPTDPDDPDEECKMKN